MRIEKTGKQIRLNGILTSRRTLEQVCRRFFTADASALVRANKKIALLEKNLAELTIKNVYLKG